jgi:hypothetical protein
MLSNNTWLTVATELTAKMRAQQTGRTQIAILSTSATSRTFLIPAQELYYCMMLLQTACARLGRADRPRAASTIGPRTRQSWISFVEEQELVKNVLPLAYTSC